MQSPAVAFAILAYDGIEPIDIGATFGVLSMAKRLAPDLRFFVVSKLGGELAMANGLGLQLCRLSAANVLMVLGGPGWQAASDDPSILRSLTSFIDAKAQSQGCALAV